MQFGAGKARIRDWLAVDSGRISDAVCGDLLNMAQRELLRRYDLRFGEDTATVAVVAGTRDYALPDGFSRPHTLWYVNPEADRGPIFLSYKPREEFDFLYPDPTVDGDPGAYTIWGNTLTLAATPTRDLTLQFNYYRVLPDLVAEDEENDFFANAWEAIFFRALVLATKFGIEDARLPVWQEEARAAEQTLLIEHSRAQHSGRRLVIQEPG